MPTLEIITIGTELLLGEITDTNSTHIARTLRDHGIDIYRITTIGDNPARITSTIKEALKRAEIIITTGGLGPTVDDPTRQAVADATDRNLVFMPELWKQVINRSKAFGRKPTENNRRQAFIPEESIPIYNPVGSAPCFIVEIGDSCVISLPGVPREMELILHESIIPFLKEKFILKSQIIKATVLHAASMGESVIDEIIDDLERKDNPTVGLLAHPGQVDIRVTAKAESEAEALKLSKPVVAELYARLGDNIYGQNEETLENVVSKKLNQSHLRLCLAEYGLEGKMTHRIKLEQPDQIYTQMLKEQPQSEVDLSEKILSLRLEHKCEVGFGIALILHNQVTVYLAYHDTKAIISKTIFYGGPPGYAPLWAQNMGLDFLRRQLNEHADN